MQNIRHTIQLLRVAVNLEPLGLGMLILECKEGRIELVNRQAQRALVVGRLSSFRLFYWQDALNFFGQPCVVAGAALGAILAKTNSAVDRIEFGISGSLAMLGGHISNFEAFERCG